jgi:hypothetical protein
MTFYIGGAILVFILIVWAIADDDSGVTLDLSDYMAGALMVMAWPLTAIAMAAVILVDFIRLRKEKSNDEDE